MPTIATKPRVDYIDLLKGITILWIIWMHTIHPDLGNYRNPIFFFLSGIFFKLSDTKTFFTKRINQILIPFLFFYLLAYPFRMVVYFWDHRTIISFPYRDILNIFQIHPNSDYLYLYVPLWFLLTIFNIQAYSFVLFRLPKPVIWITAISSLLLKEYFYTIPSPFMLNAASAWYGYFAIGYLIGKPLINILRNNKNKIIVFSSTLILFIGLVIIKNKIYDTENHLIETTGQLTFIVCAMSLFSFFDGVKQLEILRYFGKNSLLVLGTHLWVLVPLGRVAHKITGSYSPITGFIISILTAILIIPIINYLIYKFPQFVGKQTSNKEEQQFKLYSLR